MRKLAILAGAMLAAGPAAAASGPFLSLFNTNFVVLIAFLLFVGVLVYVKVPGMLGGMLDKRAEAIKAELDEARALREEAQTVLASYERKQKEAQAQVERIVETARREATEAAEEAKVALQASIQRRLKAADDQIASAQAAAVKEVRDRAIQVAVSAAAEMLAKDMSKAKSDALIDEAIATVETRLH